MLLSVENFKSIEKVVGVEISDLTVLAGVNSSGKSSIIQALLLLKQTLNSSTSDLLNLNGPYVFAMNLLDLIHNKKSGTIKLALCLDEGEIAGTEIQAYAPEGSFIEYMDISVSFFVKSDGSYLVSEFYLSLKLDNGERLLRALHWYPRKKVYDLDIGEEVLKGITVDSYSFANFFPVFVKHNGSPLELAIMKAARETMVQIMEKINYIAPLRVAPVLARTYQTDVETRYVLPDGENTRFILDRIGIESKHELLLVKEWICDKFHLAEDLNVVKETGKRYRVVVTTSDGVKVDLVHVGFGFSQILPIVTQGCISKPDSLLIVEDPDVHMHPSIQAAMADFFIFLCLERKVNVLVETHSDHFITRLRRRIAEKEILASKVHLLFVVNEGGASEYQTISMSDTGRLEGYMPSGFMDSLDADFRAIILANRK